MTTYAYTCNGLLFINEGERQISQDDTKYWSLIAAWPGTIKDMPPSLRPLLQEMYHRG